MRLVAISGSLRSKSSNTALLQAMRDAAPAGVRLDLYDRLGALPHFNPDLDADSPPAVVAELRALLLEADAVLICSPEYAHGVPGTLKNALDWLVGAGELVGKPVVLVNATARSTYAQASLTETLTVMSWKVLPQVTVELWGKTIDAGEARRALADVLRELES
ncbi:MAG TPA: NAD(P)H-dependent oxidoreductase [Thermoanaerobaculia bacterium]|nr:NAD(P)H-dependent oxidoreductase [Thermoanaerobaculia bacterium]